MTRKRTAILGSIVLGSILLAGCSTSAQPANSTNEGTTANSTSNTAPSNTSSNNVGSASQTNDSTSNTTTSQPGTSTTPPTGTPVGATTLVKQVMDLAKSGETIDVPFRDQENMETVQAAWGKPDNQTPAGAGIYATYGRHVTAFGFNKGEQIFDVRSYSSRLKYISLADIESVLGQPGEVRESSDSYIYMYPAGPDYQVLWVFSKTASGQADKTVHHVSVFWPQGTINIMAQTSPAPSVVVDNPPGSVGSLFTFSIENAPKGYRLVELEWLSRNHPSVINTVNQALKNGQSGDMSPGFSISGDGQTYSFVYPSSMQNQSGQVRLIFQATSGSALIGNSPNITLK